jgi:hypothetical protein
MRCSCHLDVPRKAPPANIYSREIFLPGKKNPATKAGSCAKRFKKLLLVMMVTMMTMMAGCIRRNDRNKQHDNSNCGQEDITNTHPLAPLPPLFF